ncbi:sugar MFS transporter [Candidatus Latescibacterota bacterium]
MIQAVALLSVFGLGIAFSILGALKLELVKSLNIDDSQFGKLISVLMFTSIFVVLTFGPIVDMFGYKPVAITGFLLGFVAVFMLISAKSYGAAVFSCILLGIGAMCMNLGNTLIPMVLFDGQNAPAALNLGNVFFGLGAFLTPFLIAMLLSRMGYKTTGRILATIIIIPVIFAIIATYPALDKTGDTIAGAIGSAFGLLANPVVIVSGLALFCYIGLEVSMGGWLSTYASSIGFSDKAANIVLSGFWVSLMIARLITSQMVTPENGVLVIGALSAVAAVAIGLMVVSKSKVAAAVCVMLTGLAFGPIFPTIVGVTFAKTAETVHGSAFGIIFALGLLGATTIPAAIGYYSKGMTIQKSLKIAMAAACILFIIAIIMGQV